MKVFSKLAVMISLGLLGAIAASAASVEQTYLETCRKDAGVPVPLSVVAPLVAADYAGSEVQVAFTVDQSGKPADLEVKSAPDDELAAVVIEAVKQWKFKPAERNGLPVATKVVLPVKIVEDLGKASSYATN